jgi:hypothetical protein
MVSMESVKSLYSSIKPSTDKPTVEEKASLLPLSGLASLANKAKDAGTKAASKVAVATGAVEAPPKTWRDDLGDALTMSWKTRFMGFVLMYGSGWLFMALATTGIPVIFIKPSKFAVPYTIGQY